VAGHENSRANTNGGIDRVFLPYSHADENAKQQGARTEHEQGGGRHPEFQGILEISVVGLVPKTVDALVAKQSKGLIERSVPGSEPWPPRNALKRQVIDD
jgi:hypothetical protein